MTADLPAVQLYLADASIELRCRELRGVERLGEAGELTLETVSRQPVDAAAVVGKPCKLVLDSNEGPRTLVCVVVRLTKLVAGTPEGGLFYRLVLRSGYALLDLGLQTRVHQQLSAPDIVKKVLDLAGWPADAIELRLTQEYPELEYVVQYGESNARFIRRVCEDAGLYFRFAVDGDREIFKLEDSSPEVEPKLSDPLTLAWRGGARPTGTLAIEPAVRQKRCAGKVTVRDYDRKHPAAELEGQDSGGTELEQATEVYIAPAKFRTAAEGAERARLHLEALRAQATVLTCLTNAYSLAPGDAFDIEAPSDYQGPQADGRWVVVGLTHFWRDGGERSLQVEAIPSETPYRLPRVTDRPSISGAHTAVVTDANDSEIHPDEDGCVFIRFHWDRFGPEGGESSLPVRVVQPQTPGSMAIPRVGWEVIVTFEDGDPDRPYILGRLYNGKQPPPMALPTNKTVTALTSYSSPGGGGRNSLHFDDAAGRQHMMLNAQFGLATTVANNRFVQTANVEGKQVGGSQTRSVGADESVSVKEAFLAKVGSQSASVGAQQAITVKGNMNVATGSETVAIGGALLEKVGNPVQGLVNLGASAVLAGAGALGSTLGPVGQALTKVATTAGGIGWGMYQAANAPGAGPNAARDAGIRGLMGAAAGLVPGGDALFASASSCGMHFPWEPPPKKPGEQAAGGGAGGARGDSAGAGGPGPGHRNTKVSGAMAEGIGATHAILTPGSVTWQTSGAELVGVGGSHSTKAVMVGYGVLGASTDTLGSFHVKVAKDAARESKGAISTTVSGALKAKADGAISITSGASLTLKVGGSLTLKGSHVSFNVGSSTVSASPGGVLIKAGTIKITGTSKQSKHTAH